MKRGRGLVDEATDLGYFTVRAEDELGAADSLLARAESFAGRSQKLLSRRDSRTLDGYRSVKRELSLPELSVVRSREYDALGLLLVDDVQIGRQLFSSSFEYIPSTHGWMRRTLR